MPILERLPVTDATRQWNVWGTTARIVVTQPELADAAQHLVEDCLDAIDEACSRFRDSELTRAQRRLSARPGQPVLVSPLLADLIRAALAAAERTGGDVDPTLADDLAALGYDRDFAQVERSSAAGRIRITVTTRIRHRWRDIRLDGARLLMPPGVHLDLGASAKAFAADTCARRVTERLGCGVLVSLGGDIAVSGTPPDGGWRILIAEDSETPTDTAGEVVAIESGAIATSSTTVRRWRRGNLTLHHLIDPRTGGSVDSPWRTASVVAATCVDANTAATAAIVMGAGAIAWLEAARLPARLVALDGTVTRLNGWPEPANDLASRDSGAVAKV
jgi:thiamine biosynthesis lipoprotein